MQNIDIAKIIKRLELIKNLIVLEEYDEINAQINKLEQLKITFENGNLILNLKEKKYTKAIEDIELYISKNNTISIYYDHEFDTLQNEIKQLENEINLLSNEKADIEKLIHEFGLRHNKELGQLIIKILQQRKEESIGTYLQEEAEEDFNNYNQEFESKKNEEIVLLNEDEQKELKLKYRKASKLCHPDVVSEEQKELAAKLFSELSEAYEKNNIKRISEILQNLENGNFFIAKSEVISEKQLLKIEIEKQRLKANELREQLQNIKDSETYINIKKIDNWDEYFKDAKQKLQLQIKE